MTQYTWTMSNDLRQGRYLVAAADIFRGTAIVSENPLVFVDCELTKGMSSTWRLVERLLSQPTALQSYYTWRLKVTEFPLDKSDMLIESSLVRRYKRPRQMIRRLYLGVATNNIGYFSADGKVAGHALYEVLSRANHSCAPNSRFSDATAGTRTKCLVADRDIAHGEAITWNYGGPLLLTGDYASRNMALAQYYRFACHCDRCHLEMPDRLRVNKDLLQHFIDQCRRS